MFPSEQALVFGQKEAVLAADLYRTVSGPRARTVDIAIAACTMANHAQLWTQNIRDSGDIPGLELYDSDRQMEWIVSNDDGGEQLVNSRIATILLRPGQYTVRVFSSSGGTGSYAIHANGIAGK